MIPLLLISFFVLLLLRVPIAVALGVSCIFGLAYQPTSTVPIVAQRVFVSIDAFALLAVPLYMLAGFIMSAGGISRRIVDFASAIVGHLPAGLAHVNILASMIFGGISGSAVADTAGIGTILIPAMRERGYPKDYTAAVTAVSSTLGVVIPPSIPMVIMGSMLGVSVGQLFLGGLIPGAAIGIALMGVAWLTGREYLHEGEGGRGRLRRIWHAFKRAFWALLMPILIISGIISGIVTVTEASAIAVVYALFAATLIYRELTLVDALEALLNTVQSTARVFFLIATAGLYSWLLTVNGFPAMVESLLLSSTDSPTLLMLMMVAILLVVTTFMESLAAMILLLPILFPIAQEIGMDPIHFGVLVIMSIGIGLVTPPVGLCLFVATDIADAKIGSASLRLIPFVMILAGLLLLFVLFPPGITFVPRALLP